MLVGMRLARVCLRRLQSDLEESASALKSAVEQAKRSANDVAHMTDELRQEQDRNATLERQRRLHEAQIKELQVSPTQLSLGINHINIRSFFVRMDRHRWTACLSWPCTRLVMCSFCNCHVLVARSK